jgi:hypothetical protein
VRRAVLSYCFTHCGCYPKASHGLITCFTSAILVNTHGVQKSLYCRDMSDIESKVLDELRACHSAHNEGKGSKVVNLKHRPPLSPGNTPGTHLC